jgi:DNA-directed RNA polymerase subunit M/transcription elongation factor TFIIS
MLAVIPPAALPRLCPVCAAVMQKTESAQRIVFNCSNCGMKTTVLPAKR